MLDNVSIGRTIGTIADGYLKEADHRWGSEVSPLIDRPIGVFDKTFAWLLSSAHHRENQGLSWNIYSENFHDESVVLGIDNRYSTLLC